MPADSPSSLARSCLNCGASCSAPYCAQCGQATSTERLTVADTLRGLSQGLASFDGRFLRTAKDLTLGPGRMVAAYVDGRRSPYANPFVYAFQTSALWFLVLIAVNPEARDNPAIAFGQLINLAIVPTLIPTIMLPFLGSRRNFSETCCFVLYIFGHAFLWRAGLSLLGLTKLPAELVNGLDGLILLVFLSWALWQFYRARVRWLIPRIVCTHILMLLISTVLANQAIAYLSQRQAGDQSESSESAERSSMSLPAE